VLTAATATATVTILTLGLVSCGEGAQEADAAGGRQRWEEPTGVVESPGARVWATCVPVPVAGPQDVAPPVCEPTGPSRTAGTGPAAGSPTPRREGGDDAPPNYEDNTAWKRRQPLPEGDRAAVEAAQRRVWTALAGMPRGGSGSGTGSGKPTPEGVTSALVAAGFDAARVQTRVAGEWVVYGLKVGAAGCVYGEVGGPEPAVRVGGTIMEFGCIEPPDPH
jgi:hypothetical protein